MNEAKVLVFDIETAPIIAYIWGLRKQYIAPNQMKSDWHVIAWAAKWLGDPPSKTMYADQRLAKDVEDDKKLLLPLWTLLDEADIVVTQNGKEFDSKKLNARFIMHGMRPPSPYKHLDTYQIISRTAAFSSNKLEFLTDKLCTKYKKLAHKKYPGMLLWKECLTGNRDAWKEMEKYNIHDVLATEELYLKVRAWNPANAPAVYQSRGRCKVCGSVHVVKSGVDRTLATLWTRLKCQTCGKWQRGEKVREAA